jgi:hypothetical protein
MKTKKRTIKVTVIVAVLLALIIAIFAMAGTTFAKYVTSQSTTNQATVAKWGYVITVDADNMFSKNYDYNSKSDQSTTLATGTTSTGASIEVASNSDSNVVAPGTTGSMSFSITGSAEVLSQITVSFTPTINSEEKYTSDVYLSGNSITDYYPIKWTLEETVNGTKNETNPVNAGKLSDVVDYLSNSSATKHADFLGTKTANTSLNYKYTLTWVWAFENTETNADKYDTVLGSISALSSKFGTSNVTTTKGVMTMPTTMPTTLDSSVTAEEKERLAELLGYTAKTTIDFNLQINVTQIQDNQTISDNS